MPRVWVSIGSNLDRERCIRGAVRALRGRFGALVLSRVYESAAVGFEGGAFYNLVAGFDSDADVAELRRSLREIEDAFGRERGGAKFSSRTLDLDILTYGDRAGNVDGIDLPRDEITRYAFVLGPLAEVAPDQLHPLEGRSFKALWAAFDRSSQPLTPVEIDLD